jgi:hypothetical protein
MGFFKTLELLFSGDVDRARKLAEENDAVTAAAEEAAFVEELTGGLKWELRDNLRENESVILCLNGCNGEAMVVTNTRVMVIKAGYPSGSWSGRKCTAFELTEITSVGFHCGFDKGLLQIVGAEIPADNESMETMTRADNVINFPADKAFLFRRVAEQLYVRTEENKKREV